MTLHGSFSHFSLQILRCLGCVFRVVVLLENLSSPQSEVLRVLEQVSLYFAPFIFPLILTSLPVPATEKHPQQHDSATSMLHRRDGARFPPDVTLGIQAKEFNLGFTRPENLVSQSCLGVFWQTPSGLSCAFY